MKRMREEYKKLDKAEMSIWECCVLLNDVVDDSDPDLDEPQIEHLLQTAEAIRKDYPNEDWLHLTALIHGMTQSNYFEDLLESHGLKGLLYIEIFLYMHFLRNSFFVLSWKSDLGKVLCLPAFGGLPQWAVVGECPLSIIGIKMSNYFISSSFDLCPKC